MSAIVDTPEQAAALAQPPLLVRRPLEELLDAHGLGEGPVEAEPLGEGHSNITYAIRRRGGEWVLRRPPRPPLPPSAHDVLREYQLLAALRDAPVRLPRPILACANPAVIGAPFYVMEKLEGHVITSALPTALDTAAQRRGIAQQLVDALVELHRVDWRSRGLEQFGRPSGYLDRQLRRFSGLWEHNRTRELPTLERVGSWLAANRPSSTEATIVHGDYRLGNTMFAQVAPARLIAIFDWELATIGDPLADVGYLVASYTEPGEAHGTIFSRNAVTTAPGFPSRQELVTRYEEGSGRSVSEIAWYMALALWKAAIFLEGSYRRLLAGTTDDPFFALLDHGVPELAERAWQVAREA